MKAEERFRTRISPHMQQLIDAGVRAVAEQFVPSNLENQVHPSEIDDPIGDSAHSPLAGLVHRHADRVLFKPTLECAVRCRFCFRRKEIEGDKADLSHAEIEAALTYISMHTEIREVILTGGDPLVLETARLSHLLTRLCAIPHLKLLRIHTRIPVVFPPRIDEELTSLIASLPLPLWIVVHTNSHHEIGDEAYAALRALHRAGASLLSQSVLLNGVNASASALEALFRRLLECGVKPYYLHYPDLAPGTSHFRIPLNDAILLMKRLRGQVSGLCLPQLIVDLPGGLGKVAVGEGTAPTPIGNGMWRFVSPITDEPVTVTYQVAHN